MTFSFLQLNPELVRKHVDSLIRIDTGIQIEMKTVYGNDPWEKSHFLRDLPRKWVYSHMALRPSDDNPCGFIIACEKRAGQSIYTACLWAPVSEIAGSEAGFCAP